MHTRQGAAEPARSQHNLAQDPALDRSPHEYLLAHVLGQGPNCSRITVGPYWLEYLITFYVTCPRLLLLVLALLATAVALLVGER